MKKLTILAISLFTLGLSGCASDKRIIEDQKIKSDIGEQIFSRFINTEYRAGCFESDDDDSHPCPIQVYDPTEITENCLENLVIRERDVETERLGMLSKGYKLSDLEQINKRPFLECTKRKLNDISLEAKQLEAIVNRKEYKKAKNGNNKLFDSKTKEIKEKGYMTILDGYELINIIIIYNETLNKNENNEKSKEIIENL